MIYEIITKNILKQLGISKTYSGYEYLAHAIGLIFFDERFYTTVTKELYITVAQNCNTSAICVEKNIRNVINTIWANLDNNKDFIVSFFGTCYLRRKPTNKEFIGLIYEYIKLYFSIEEILKKSKIACPISKCTCCVYTEIIGELINLY